MELGSFEHRFGGIQRLYGVEQAEKIRKASVCFIGIGGVGCWIAEALARCGIGKITLIDWDDICLTNTNRQVHAMNGTVGKAKVDVMAERITLINPDCEVNAVREYFTKEKSEEMLDPGFDYVFDAIDNATVKCVIINECRRKNIPVIVSGGAGGRIDPMAVQTADLSRSFEDPLLARVRKELRTDYGYTRNPKRKFNTACVFSSEKPKYPQEDGCVAEVKPSGKNMKMDCFTGFGTATFITGVFGFAMAAHAVKKIAEK
jgi:tRNA A37 threonylcarbamoyladenosine dehydratase